RAVSRERPALSVSDVLQVSLSLPVPITGPELRPSGAHGESPRTGPTQRPVCKSDRMTSNMKTLTAKQTAFRDAILSGFAPSEAYRKAFDAKAMSKKSISVNAQKLL